MGVEPHPPTPSWGGLSSPYLHPHTRKSHSRHVPYSVGAMGEGWPLPLSCELSAGLLLCLRPISTAALRRPEAFSAIGDLPGQTYPAQVRSGSKPCFLRDLDLPSAPRLYQ